MRILIHGINFHPEEAGTGKYTGEMADWLASAGHEVRIVTAPPHFPQWRVAEGYSAWKYRREQRAAGGGFARMAGAPAPSTAMMEIFRCPIWVPVKPGGMRRLLYLASFALSSLPVMLRQIAWRPDVVLLIEPTLACAAQVLLVARLSGAKAWLHVQDFEVDAAFELGDYSSAWARKWAFALESWILHRFDRVSAISERMVDRLQEKRVHPSRCVLFPNWVDTSVIQSLPGPSALRQELGIADRTVVALYSGSMGKKQGLELLVDAARRLSHCPHLRFVFCGEGSGRNALAEKAQNLQNVSLLPFQPASRLNNLLNLADIHLLPQRAEAADLVMPSKLTGMLASGRPVVVTARSGTQLATAVQGCGVVVPPGDPDAFAAAILELSANEGLRQLLGQSARSYALAHLDFRVILDRFEQALQAACNQSVCGPAKEQERGATSETQLGSLPGNLVRRQNDSGVTSTPKVCP
jgi:colanic acid biosynthesis glycosyl transferase WcaI